MIYGYGTYHRFMGFLYESGKSNINHAPICVIENITMILLLYWWQLLLMFLSTNFFFLTIITFPSSMGFAMDS